MCKGFLTFSESLSYITIQHITNNDNEKNNNDLTDSFKYNNLPPCPAVRRSAHKTATGGGNIPATTNQAAKRGVLHRHITIRN